MNKPLEGVRVLDLSRVLAGPWATQLLADLGADVIKVEQPGEGDDTRHWGPPWHEHGGEKVAAYFLAANRGKRSVAIDFAAEEGAALVRRMATDVDVVVENFRVGGLKKFGLDAESLRAADPRLIYASITGFGQDGPYAQRAGYDYIIQGMGGLMSLTGVPDGEPGGGPMKVGVAVADLFTGMYTANAILAALYRREQTGEGATIDMALLDTQLAMLANQASNSLVSGVDPKRLGAGHPNIVPYQPFKAADQPIIIAVGNDRQFAKLAEILGHPEWATDPAYATNAARVAPRPGLRLSGFHIWRKQAFPPGRSTPSARRWPTRSRSIAAHASALVAEPWAMCRWSGRQSAWTVSEPMHRYRLQPSASIAYCFAKCWRMRNMSG